MHTKLNFLIPLELDRILLLSQTSNKEENITTWPRLAPNTPNPSARTGPQEVQDTAKESATSAERCSLNAIMGLAYNTYLNCNKIYGCKNCKAHLANHDDIISRVRPLPPLTPEE